MRSEGCKWMGRKVGTVEVNGHGSVANIKESVGDFDVPITA